MVAALPGIVWEADGTDYEMSYISSGARELLGHDPAEWIRVKGFWEAHLHPDDRERAIAAVDRAVADLANISCEYRFRAADGEYRHFRDVVRVIERPDGHRHLVGFMLDITDEASATAERRLLAAAVTHADESMLITDQVGAISYVNPAFERLTGYGAAETLGRSAGLLRAHGPGLGDSVWQVASEGRPWKGDLEVRRSDGTVFTEEASVAPVLDDGGRVCNVVIVGRDVTAERAQQQVQARLAAIVESAADAGYANDLDGTYLAWNDAAERIYGWSRAEVLGRSIFDLVGSDEHDSIRAWLDTVAAGRSIGPVDAVHRGRDGRPLTLSVSATPVYDAEGRVTGIATIARDVSDERRLTAERLALETQLLQAQKLEAIGRLAGGLAHDFNNMLTAIGGYAELVASSLTGTLLEDQRQVLRAAERASDLTQRLLAFTRSAPLDPRPVDLDAVLHDAYRMVGRLVPERIRFEIATGAGCHVHADPVEIEQLLLNLVINAADAIPGAGRIDVRTLVAPGDDIPAGHDADRPWAMLSVTDTGAGMDEATQARVFDPFFTTKEPGQGTGLGLATVQAIVRRAGGLITIRSAPGEGTTFEAYLPVVAAGDAGGGVPHRAQRGGAEHILVVDDEPVIADLAARMLRLAGYRVTVRSGPEAALALGTGSVDAIVSDVIMPGMSGVELIRRLETDLPVVFMSGYTGSQLPDDLRLGPRRAFLDKPFGTSDLLGAVRAILDADDVVAKA
jgi:PAS domain S-box-containing protein